MSIVEDSATEEDHSPSETPDEVVADESPDGPPASGGLSWPKVVALVAAFAWLAGATGWFIAQDRPPSAGSVDAGFYLDMITHHDQAVQLALLELENGENRSACARPDRWSARRWGCPRRPAPLMNARITTWSLSPTMASIRASVSATADSLSVRTASALVTLACATSS